jgi:hypothetical protein
VNRSRTFRHKERISLQINAEFLNIFIRTQIGNPSTSSPGSAASRNIYGRYAAGFGAINERLSGLRIAPSSTPECRGGTVVPSSRAPEPLSPV